MKYLLILTAFLSLFAIEARAQNLDEAFDDNGLSDANNIIYLSSVDIIRGFPSITLKHVFPLYNSSSNYFVNVAAGKQLYPQLWNQHLYYLNENFLKNIPYLPAVINKGFYLSGGFGVEHLPTFFTFANTSTLGFKYCFESYYQDTERINVHSVWFDFGFEFLLAQRFHIAFNLNFGGSFAKYPPNPNSSYYDDMPLATPSYKLDILFGYSF